jgi:hypothetical protein
MKLSEGLTSRPKMTTAFAKASQVNRSVGYLYGELAAKKYLAQDPNLWQTRGYTSPEQFIDDNGRAWARQVEFDTSTSHIGPAFRSPLAKILLQYKPYAVKQYEQARNVTRSRPSDIPVVSKAARVGKYVGGRAAVGGARAFGVLPKALGGIALLNGLSRELQRQGMSKKNADNAAKVMQYGAPALAGVDLSGKVGMFEAPYGASPQEQVANYALGPSIGTLFSLMQNYPKGAGAMAQATLPLVRQGGSLANLITGKPNLATVGQGKKIKLTPLESGGQILGFPPLRRSILANKIAEKPKRPSR